MKQPIDNFSQGGADYAAFRPASPDALFDFLYSNVGSFEAAWDCGTGNGQVAARLAERFKEVYATDISEDQLQYAAKKDNITYRKERAEQTSLADNSIDLVTVAQAIHWFDFEPFYAEVTRVARPGALFAAWTYTRLKVNTEVDKVIKHLYKDITGPYWDKQRGYVDGGYEQIPFPFKEVQTPEFSIVKRLSVEQLAGYLRTWSGVQHYMKQEQKDPVAMVMNDLLQAWGGTEAIEVLWPVRARVGIVKPHEH